MNLDISAGTWLFPPRLFSITAGSVTIVTDPDTDFWQRSYYGFRHDNAPAYLFENSDNFSLTACASFDYKATYDQCGLIVYLDSDNWFKASIEYENAAFSRLGSVVTNNGYSDWATTDIASTSVMWYRLSRRGPDFLIESSPDGTSFRQMRIFHLHALGETTPDMGTANPPLPAAQTVRFGMYACSPLQSSFTARFDAIAYGPCSWRAHGSD